MILYSLDFPILTATVEFHAVLKKNGSQIFEKDVRLVKEENYSVWSEWGWQDVSDMAGKVLDDAVTESIKMLFEEIAAEI